MTVAPRPTASNAAIAASGATKTCFVVMPMSDAEPYPPGHWNLVYRELFKLAAKKAGFEVKRADTSQQSGIIMLDVLRQLYHADIVLCDTSSQRANVLFELGLRQAFDRPVVIVRDELASAPL